MNMDVAATVEIAKVNFATNKVNDGRVFPSFIFFFKFRVVSVTNGSSQQLHIAAPSRLASRTAK